ncbi:MAG: multiheme c-type cytochrome, partial [bacterium]
MKSVKVLRSAYRSITFFVILTAFLIGSISITGCYNRPKAPEHLRIIFTSDTQGNFTPCGCAGGPRGGLERRSTAIKEAIESAPGQVIVLDTGNFSTGMLTDLERLKAEYVANAMDMIGYDAVNVGHMDALRPREGVLTYNHPQCPLTSGAFTYENKESGERQFSYPSNIILERDKFRIGIIGHLLDNYDPKSFGLDNNYIEDPRQLSELINRTYMQDNAGMVILITDLSALADQTGFMTVRYNLASIIIAGASAEPDFTVEKKSGEIEHPIVIPRAASWGRSLGILDLELNRIGGITGYSLRYVDLNDKIEKDPLLAQLTGEYMEKINAKPTGLPELKQSGFIGPIACKSCHESEYEQWSKTKHATAWKALEDSGRIEEAACTPCHSTGFTGSESVPYQMIAHDFRNVSCEACHGAGEAHMAFHSSGNSGDKNSSDPIVL